MPGEGVFTLVQTPRADEINPYGECFPGLRIDGAMRYIQSFNLKLFSEVIILRAAAGAGGFVFGIDGDIADYCGGMRMLLWSG